MNYVRSVQREFKLKLRTLVKTSEVKYSEKRRNITFENYFMSVPRKSAKKKNRSICRNSAFYDILIRVRKLV